MPYIRKNDRLQYEELLEKLLDLLEQSGYHPGHMNFVISDLINKCLGEEGMSYTNANKWIGSLECAKLEIYRRLLVPYENDKCQENGEVFK